MNLGKIEFGYIVKKEATQSLTVKMMYRNILALEAPKAHYLDFEKIPDASNYTIRMPSGLQKDLTEPEYINQVT